MLVRREIISSRNNPTVKWAASLKDKKGRDAARAFIAEGEKLTIEAAEAGLPLTHVFVSEEKYEKIMPKLKKALSAARYNDTEIFILKPGVFEKISTEIAPQGVISVIKHLDFFRQTDIIYKEEFSKLTGERLIALCSVRDPGNLGSVIRSAVAFGVSHIILSSDCADLYNPKTVRSAMGSLFRVKATVVSCLPDFISAANAAGRRVYAAELTDGAVALGDAELSPYDVVIIGNEGHGIPADISALCDGSIYIPISSKTESLNASVAAAVFMWEQSK